MINRKQTQRYRNRNARYRAARMEAVIFPVLGIAACAVGSVLAVAHLAFVTLGQ